MSFELKIKLRVSSEFQVEKVVETHFFNTKLAFLT